MSKDKKCPNCGGDIAIRNPTGNCDHLHYPENVPPMDKDSISLCKNCFCMTHTTKNKCGKCKVHKSKPRQPVYKIAKILKPHCPVCKMILSGDNSTSDPWKCFCGEWENTSKNPFDFEIKEEKY
jgi:hypothetical protein